MAVLNRLLHAPALRRNGRENVAAFVLLALLCVVPLAMGSDFYRATAVIVLTNAMLGISLVVLYGYAGQLSFAYAALYGVGAFLSAFAVTKWGMTPLEGVVIGTLGTVVVGSLVALPALRLSGLQLGLVTLALSLASVAAFGKLTHYEGIPAIPPLQFGDFNLFNTAPQLLVMTAIVAVTYLAMAWLLASRHGARFLLVKVDAKAAQSVGVNVVYEKLLAFAVSSLLLGLVGSLYPLMYGFLAADQFSFDLVTKVFLLAIIGGTASLAGPLLGATVLGALDVLLGTQAEISTLYLGVAMLVSFIFLPRGLIGLVRRHSAPPAVVAEERDEIDVRPAAEVTRRPAGDVVLRVDDVSKTFKGLRALQHVSLDVREGEIVALIGSNGAGKSTLINAITGFLTPDRGGGGITFHGEDVTAWGPHRRARAGMVRTSQFPALVPELDVATNLSVAVARDGVDQAAIDPGRTLEELGLSGYADRKVAELPFGVQKLIEMSRAVNVQPSLVLLDEPVAGLAPAELPAVTTMLHRLRALGISVLLVEHNMPFVMSLADRVFVLDHGTMISSGTPAEIRADAGVIEAYLGTGGGETLRVRRLRKVRA
jgi:branched-chain amino acid transport system permease protein